VEVQGIDPQRLQFNQSRRETQALEVRMKKKMTGAVIIALLVVGVVVGVMV
jgi:hypothetical protein